MRKNALVIALLGAVAFAPACAAVYPELATPVHAPLTGQELEPPPENVKWIALKGASVPRLTRDGRTWGTGGKTTPTAYAIVFVNGQPIIRTEPEADTFTPTWPSAKRGNFALTRGDRIRIELWESRPVSDRPIGVRDITFTGDVNDENELTVLLDGGAEVTLKIEPARPVVGMGFRYELRGVDGVFVTRVVEHSPAGRAGIKPGDQIVAIDGRPTHGMNEAEIRSLLNMHHPQGLALKLRRADGTQAALSLKDGAIYALEDELPQ